MIHPRRRRTTARRGLAAAESVVAMAIMAGIAVTGFEFAQIVAHNLHQVIVSIVGSPYL